MHGHYRQAFSEDEKSRLKFVQPEESAEAQANWFAACFLAPDYLARQCKNESELCLQFDFPSDFASVKLDDIKEVFAIIHGQSMFHLWQLHTRARCGAIEVRNMRIP